MFKIVSYAKAKLELYDRKVEHEFQTEEEMNTTIEASEFLKDALGGENVGGRVYRTEETEE